MCFSNSIGLNSKTIGSMSFLISVFCLQGEGEGEIQINDLCFIRGGLQLLVLHPGMKTSLNIQYTCNKDNLNI